MKKSEGREMTQYMVMLKVNPKTDENQLSNLTKELGMQPTQRSLEKVKVLVFEGSTREFYQMKAKLESGIFDDYFTLIDTGQATSFELEALENEHVFSQETVAKINQFLPNLDWQNFRDNLKRITQSLSNKRERINQTLELLYELAGLSPEPLSLARSDRGGDSQGNETEKIKDELYELASELIDQLTEFQESHE
jgi:hypothetical protein